MRSLALFWTKNNSSEKVLKNSFWKNKSQFIKKELISLFNNNSWKVNKYKIIGIKTSYVKDFNNYSVKLTF